jgi:hypothetical protein
MHDLCGSGKSFTGYSTVFVFGFWLSSQHWDPGGMSLILCTNDTCVESRVGDFSRFAWSVPLI